jgi:DNA-binding MarR family transcriptional regulator
MVTDTKQTAERLASLTFNLLAKCQEKEAWVAEQHGLFPSEFKCLRLLGDNENLNNKDIAQKMNLSPSRLTRIIDGLVKKGYMLREIDIKDRRNMRLKVVRKGKLLTHKLDNSYVEIHKEILESIDPAKHEALIVAMENLHFAIEKWLLKSV